MSSRGEVRRSLRRALAAVVLVAAPFAGAAMDVTPLWNFADPAGSEAAFRAALETPRDRDDVLILQTQIARTFSLRSRFADAHDDERLGRLQRLSR